MQDQYSETLNLENRVTENFINNQRTNIQDYTSFTSSLWESYGQHEQQKLLNEILWRF